MGTTKPTPEQPSLPGFGIVRDLQRLKTHGTASVAELREFLAQTRGRSPQEVLGMVAGSQLMRSIAVATVGAVVVLVVGTVGPWWWYGAPAGAKPAAKPAVAPQAAAPAPAAPAKSAPAEQLKPTGPAAPAAATADSQPSPADAEKAVKVMGLGETKVADPNKNPLEKSLDNLLDKLE
jgi:hypothetical protein